MLFQYATALIALALLAYCVWRHGRRALWFVAGAVPPAVALGAYDWAAFGSPFHLSYRYVANEYAERPAPRVLRHRRPDARRAEGRARRDARAALFLAGPRRGRGRAVAAVASRHARGGAARGRCRRPLRPADAGYFLVYGGGTPGPRFLAPALPFLALGLPVVLARWPRPTLVLAFASAVLTTVDALSWGVRPPDDTAWFPNRNEISQTIWAWVVPDRNVVRPRVLALRARGRQSRHRRCGAPMKRLVALPGAVGVPRVLPRHARRPARPPPLRRRGALRPLRARDDVGPLALSRLLRRVPGARAAALLRRAIASGAVHRPRSSGRWPRAARPRSCCSCSRCADRSCASSPRRQAWSRFRRCSSARSSSTRTTCFRRS